jgi:putative SOS response-associated peptidase YedK
MRAHLALVAPVHPKVMPVILHDKDYDRWLSAPWENLKELVAPYPSQLMDASSQAEQEGNMLRPYIGVRGSGRLPFPSTARDSS